MIATKGWGKLKSIALNTSKPHVAVSENINHSHKSVVDCYL